MSSKREKREKKDRREKQEQKERKDGKEKKTGRSSPAPLPGLYPAGQEPQSWDAWKALGTKHYLERRFPQAMQCYKRASKPPPPAPNDRAAVLGNIAATALEMGDYGLCLITCLKARLVLIESHGGTDPSNDEISALKSLPLFSRVHQRAFKAAVHDADFEGAHHIMRMLKQWRKNIKSTGAAPVPELDPRVREGWEVVETFLDRENAGLIAKPTVPLATVPALRARLVSEYPIEYRPYASTSPLNLMLGSAQPADVSQRAKDPSATLEQTMAQKNTAVMIDVQSDAIQLKDLSRAQRKKLSFLFGGCTDGRHALATMEELHFQMKKLDPKEWSQIHAHMLLNDTSAHALAKNVVMLENLLALGRLRDKDLKQGTDAALQTGTLCYHLFSSPFLLKEHHAKLVTQLDRLISMSKCPYPWLHCSDGLWAEMRAVWEEWRRYDDPPQQVMKETTVTSDPPDSMAEAVKMYHGEVMEGMRCELQKLALGAEPAGLEQFGILMMELDMISRPLTGTPEQKRQSLLALLGTMDYASLFRLQGNMKVFDIAAMYPGTEADFSYCLSTHLTPLPKKLAEFKRVEGVPWASAPKARLLAQCKSNPLLAYSKAWCEAGDTDPIENNPPLFLENLLLGCREAGRFEQPKLKPPHNDVFSYAMLFFKPVANAVYALLEKAHVVHIELVRGDCHEVAANIRAANEQAASGGQPPEQTAGRPQDARTHTERRFDRIYLSCIPDYTGMLNTFVDFVPLLSGEPYSQLMHEIEYSNQLFSCLNHYVFCGLGTTSVAALKDFVGVEYISGSLWRDEPVRWRLAPHAHARMPPPQQEGATPTLHEQHRALQRARELRVAATGPPYTQEELHDWLLQVFLMVAHPPARNPYASQRLPFNGTLSAWFGLLRLVASGGSSPPHWVATLLEDMLNNRVATRARPLPDDRPDAQQHAMRQFLPPISWAAAMKTRPVTKLDLTPYMAELRALAALWQGHTGAMPAPECTPEWGRMGAVHVVQLELKVRLLFAAGHCQPNVGTVGVAIFRAAKELQAFHKNSQAEFWQSVFASSDSLNVVAEMPQLWGAVDLFSAVEWHDEPLSMMDVNARDIKAIGKHIAFHRPALPQQLCPYRRGTARIWVPLAYYDRVIRAPPGQPPRAAFAVARTDAWQTLSAITDVVDGVTARLTGRTGFSGVGAD